MLLFPASVICHNEMDHNFQLKIVVSIHSVNILTSMGHWLGGNYNSIIQVVYCGETSGHPEGPIRLCDVIAKKMRSSSCLRHFIAWDAVHTIYEGTEGMEIIFTNIAHLCDAGTVLTSTYFFSVLHTYIIYIVIGYVVATRWTPFFCPSISCIMQACCPKVRWISRNRSKYRNNLES